MTQRPTDPLHGMGRPLLPQGLEERVLNRARQAARRKTSLTDRLWESRPLRLAWAVTVTLLVVVQLALAMPGSFSEPPGLERVESIGAPDSFAELELLPFLARHPPHDRSRTGRLFPKSLEEVHLNG